MFRTEGVSEAVVQHTPGADLPPGAFWGTQGRRIRSSPHLAIVSKLAGAGLVHGAAFT